MADLSLDLDGIPEAIDELEQVEDDWADADAWFVGTAVEYAIYLEFGTSKMDPKPFFRPALNELQRLGVEGYLSRHTATSLAAIDGVQTLVTTLANALERHIKQVITQKGLVETGTLRASITATPQGLGALPTADDISADVEVGG